MTRDSSTEYRSVDVTKTYTFEQEIEIGGVIRFRYEHSEKRALREMGDELANIMDGM